MRVATDGWAAAGCLGLLSSLLSGCVGWFNLAATYDAKPLTITTVSLFNQRLPSRLSRKNWKGDWIFRRDRLAMVDQDLRTTKPDLLLLQEVLDRIGNPAESDKAILVAGALTDYDWRQQEVKDYPDTQETEAMAVAFSPALHWRSGSDTKRESWALGDGGYLLLTTLAAEDQPVLVASVQMPHEGIGRTSWYGFLRERLIAKIASEKLCAKRLIVGGFLPGDEAAEAFSEFVSTLHLRDTAQGFCQLAGRCYTATPSNDLFTATVGEETPVRTDKIFVHRSANISSSGRAFDTAANDNLYGREFGLEHFWPTQRFGWRAQVRLGRCQEGEFGAASL